VLELEFTPDDVARTRFAFSPLWETVMSVRVLHAPAFHSLHLPWVRQARERLAAAGAVPGLLADLVPAPRRYIPDFLTPPPTTPVPDFEAELATLAATPPGQVRADLERMGGEWPAEVSALHDDPAGHLHALVAGIRSYWQAAVAPHWPRIRGLLEGEVSYRARRLTEGGAHLLFRDLHPRVSWEEDRLLVRQHHHSNARRLGGEGLVLVPWAMVWPSVYSISNPPWQPTLLYPPRGLATLWATGTGVGGPDALAGVLGRGRAGLLAALEAPASTTELSRRTGLTAGGVSQHLSALRRAGLVVSHRAGRSVLYARTTVAESLVTAAGDS
jgi:DNA-binding transcriptional ArsR family regulator